MTIIERSVRSVSTRVQEQAQSESNSPTGLDPFVAAASAIRAKVASYGIEAAIASRARELLVEYCAMSPGPGLYPFPDPPVETLDVDGASRRVLFVATAGFHIAGLMFRVLVLHDGDSGVRVDRLLFRCPLGSPVKYRRTFRDGSFREVLALEYRRRHTASLRRTSGRWARRRRRSVDRHSCRRYAHRSSRARLRPAARGPSETAAARADHTGARPRGER